MKTFSDQDYQLDAKYADHEGPPAAPDCRGRTAGGLGGAAPASLDLYGQSRTKLILCIGDISALSFVEGLGVRNPSL